MAARIGANETRNRRLAASGLIAFVVVCVLLALALFTGFFKSRVPLTVVSDRSGLVMDAEAKVRSRGVTIGAVKQIRQELGGAVLDLEVDPDELDKIPANAPVHIGSNTIFGAKSVDFQVPATPDTRNLQEGDTIRAAGVTTEVNTLFEKLTTLLQATDPQKLNATLGAIAGALDGRGDQLGATLVDLDQYLATVNPELDTLQRDLVKGSRVAALYGDVTPDLMRTLDAGTDVGNNLVRNQANFEALLARAASTGASGKKLLDANGNQVIKSMKDLRAAASLVAEYSPSLSCMIVGLNQGVEQNGQAFGAVNQPGLVFKAGFQQGAKPYTYPEDLPKVNASTGPRCYGLPFPASGTHAPFAVTDVGSNVMAGMPNVFKPDGNVFKPLDPLGPGKAAPPTLLQVMLGMNQGTGR